MDILIGADPEVFVHDGDKFVTGHGLVNGTKYQPQKVQEGAVQVDGMALEFNIDPCMTEDEFVKRIGKVMWALRELIDPKLELVAQPTAEFGPEYMKTMPKEALELGCDPDFNAWKDGAVNPKPDGNRTFRTGAGHVHIGWTNGQDINDPEHVEACIMLTKQLDFYLGIPSVLYDADTQRRTMYGDFGAFRPKPYGVEYRVLSNAWLNSPKLMRWVFRQTKKAFDDLMEGKYICNTYNKNFLDRLKTRQNPASQIEYAKLMVQNMRINKFNVEIPEM